jgi:hypothetical protein
MTIHPSIGKPASVRKGCLVELFEARGVIEAFIAQHWPARDTPAGVERRAQFLRRKTLNERRLRGEPVADSDDESEDLDEPPLFALEAHLRDFIAGNLARMTIASKRLTLFKDESGRGGVEYPTAVGQIDILTTDSEGSFYVFELKLERGPDRALGQLARYMGWVKLNLAGERRVVGVIVASSIDEKLRYAVSVIPDAILLEYEVAFKIRGVDAMNAAPSADVAAGQVPFEHDRR